MDNLSAQNAAIRQRLTTLEARQISGNTNTIVAVALGTQVITGCKVMAGGGMVVELQGQATGDEAHWNPLITDPPIPSRAYTYGNTASLLDGPFVSADQSATVGTVPATGLGRYDIAFIYTGASGAGFQIASGTPGAPVKTAFDADGLDTELYPSSSGFDPDLPIGAFPVARIYVENDEAAIINARIADIRVIFDRDQGPVGPEGPGNFTYVGYAEDSSGTGYDPTPDPSRVYIAFLSSAVEIPVPDAGDFAGLWERYIGTDGVDGVNAYVYIGYAEDNTGTGFALTPDPTRKFVAFLSTDTELSPPEAADFAGLWEDYFGEDAYVYIGYAEDASGTGFALTPDPARDYVAFLSTDTEIPSPVAGDFAGLWKYYKGPQGNGLILKGTLPNLAALPGSPAEGDAYKVNGDGNGHIFIWDDLNSEWDDYGPLQGPAGDSAYLYIGYAEDASGTGYDPTPDITRPYIAALATTTEIPSPVAGDFAGLWVKFIGEGIQPETVGFTATAGTTPKTLTVDVDLTASEVVTLNGVQILTNKTITGLQINDTSADHQYILAVSELAADRTITLPLLAGDDVFVFASHVQTLAGKTFTLPKISDTSADHTYNILVSELAASRNITLPLLTADDTFVFNSFPATLSAKKLTNPSYTLDADGTISGGTWAIDYANGPSISATAGANITSITMANWPATGTTGHLKLFLTNFGAYTITFPSAWKFVKSDLTTTTTFADLGLTLPASGTCVADLVSTDGGTTIYVTFLRN
jgi:hypothetical protein